MDDLYILTKKRSALKIKLTTFESHINAIQNKSLSNLQRFELEVRLSKFDTLWNEFDKLQMEIEILEEEEDNEERDEFEKLYYLLYARARHLLANAEAGKDESNESGKDESAVANKEESNGASKGESVEAGRDESNEADKDESVEGGKNESNKADKSESNEAGKDESVEGGQDESNEAGKDESNVIGKDRSVTGSAVNQIGRSIQQNFIELPEIELPQFNGSYQCWVEYKEMYLALIHNNCDLDDIIKLCYLRETLQGSAKDIIKYVGCNYQLAWDLLCQRYENKWLLVNIHLQAMFNVEDISKESYTSLRSLVGVINKNIKALKLLDQPTEFWDTLIIYIMSSKLDPITNRYWEEYRIKLPYSPTLRQFCTFILDKADLLELYRQNSNEPRNSTNATNNTDQYSSNIKIKCPLCSNEHHLHNCETFRGLPVKMRISKCKDLKVCFNCLRRGHLTKRCRLSHCKYCNIKHNTLLHVQ